MTRHWKSDNSGMMIVAADHDLGMRRIQFVTPKSPAAEAGLKSGDQLVRINGSPADAQGLHATRELFYEANKKHVLEIQTRR